MQQKLIGNFLKYFILAFICTVVCLLIFRDHFILGTALIIGRWGLLVLGVFLFFLTTKRITSKYLKYFLLVSITCIGLEFIFTKLNEASSEETAGNTEVSLMTYNLFFKNKSRLIILEQIKENNPDILVVQELTPTWAIFLSNSIGKNYPYQIIHTNKGTHGLGVYSKYKLSNNILLLNDNKKLFAQTAEISVSDKKIQLIHAHLASPAAAVEHPAHFFSLFNKNYSQREDQLEQIKLIAKKNPCDANVLIGDLNTTPYEPLYRKFRNDWIDVFNEAGTGDRSTFPNTDRSQPFLTLDYILIKGAATAVSATVITNGSSDHLALAGRIKI